MKILITGGAGFMGSNFIHYILRKYPGYKIVNFDKLTYAGNLDNLRDIENDPRYQFIRGDIADQKAIEESVQGVDVIINYAAETHVDRSIMDPEAFLRTDIFGTYNLLEAVRKNNISRMIQISTDEVYGSLETGEATENTAFMPSSPYSAAKAGGDHMCRAYFVTYQTPIIVTHSVNFYGPNQYPEKIVPLFITNLLENKKVPVYGDGMQIREWIYTEDHCHAIDLILHKGIAGEVYNIGSGERIPNIETTKKIFSLLFATEDMVEYVKDRPGHDVRYAVDHSKLTRELGWKPGVSFDEGLRKTVEWYKNNSVWWKKIKSGKYLEYYKKQYVK